MVTRLVNLSLKVASAQELLLLRLTILPYLKKNLETRCQELKPLMLFPLIEERTAARYMAVRTNAMAMLASMMQTAIVDAVVISFPSLSVDACL